ncbi:MAG: tRNA epoxyqueuosine(34) reductase QueG [Rhodospirillaceae bacterium TMED8]|nr:tRNA epoxyqueuosine(34) reductase QueG [Magnetovibrio sp.]OUT49860.1 MAG: tRNA epoxyqueuosine(34) reductase QueG [Rhodospirillaceae bacterium TMED8]
MNKVAREAIRQHALNQGFDAVGFTSAHSDPKDHAALAKFLKKNWHGDMSWMAEVGYSNVNPRGKPRALMPEAQTIIVLGSNYTPSDDPMFAVKNPKVGAISVYARPKRDYHYTIKKRLKKFGRWLVKNYAAKGIKVFVDTAPIMEKPLAARSGIGWQGKHTNLVSRDFGSWLFLSEVFTTLRIAPDLPEPDHCGSCTACMDACPTDAFPAPYQLDARRCISYLTIEHKAMIAPSLMTKMGNHIFGCDDCLTACPWNKFAMVTKDPVFEPREDLSSPLLSKLLKLDDDAFRSKFAGSSIKRLGRSRFIRNVLIAVANSGDHNLISTVELLFQDTDKLVAKTANWAHAQLSTLDQNKGSDNHFNNNKSQN